MRPLNVRQLLVLFAASLARGFHFVVIGGAVALSGVAIVLLRAPKGRIIEPGAPEPVVVLAHVAPAEKEG